MILLQMIQLDSLALYWNSKTTSYIDLERTDILVGRGYVFYDIQYKLYLECSFYIIQCILCVFL